MNSTIAFTLAGLLLLWNLCSIPSLLKNKKNYGSYFVQKSFIIPKWKGYGNSFNMKNRFGFSLNLFFVCLFVLIGLFGH
ncbi:hypothetical protein [Enterococcus phoeniculicola]|jgi:hypothetical protein|uniref:Uncharacterized protein n=1 Tax=Enterococcus phoeniculicola ATCC BAA-412 TaxID=1158610 RepID=R3TY65_9ENTE|nr:hypothetical protein [Enterococcus phoeniculicola]EOL46083.1 hypothetical protein UC3_00888 [Enterococcus phoeniculicola ATCC BAA-412]EOT77072.1 hypothetical protein I589_02034 [Enterococcus phoeniculicola ATCC BAA-412]